MRRSVSISLVFLLVILSAGGCFRREGIGPGEQAPDFTLNNLHGQSESLASFKGSVVVLNFWASWCAPCLQEMPALEQLFKKFPGKEVIVVAVAEDESSEEVQKVANSFKLSFPVLVDSDGTIKDKYKVSGYPETFVIDKQGKIVFFPDPENGTPVTKIVGPRDWTSSTVIAQLKAIADS